jgi:hypothetical protein
VDVITIYFQNNSIPVEALAKFAISLIPAKARIHGALKNWIPGHAPLARNDAILHFSRLLQEALFT